MLRAFSYVRTAAHSLHIVSKTLDMSQDFEKEDLSSTTLQNIRLQLDCVVPSLCDVIESVPHLSVENVDTKGRTKHFAAATTYVQSENPQNDNSPI